MANTLSDLTADLYAALHVVSRELVGFIPAVSRNSSAERVAIGDTVRIPEAPAATAYDVTPSQLQADNGDNVFTNRTMTISKERYVPIRWTGREQRSMNNGAGYANLRVQQFAEAMRTLVNEIEADIASLYTQASVAQTPAGTNLFDAANYKDFAACIEMLDNNGAPISDRHLVINSAAKRAILGNAQYVGANTSGDQGMLRQGVLLDHLGLDVRASAQVKNHTAGDAASATTDNAGYSVGDTVLTLASAGTGAILAGDVITITGDASATKYVVESGDADVSGGGTITLAAPGLKGDLSAATHAITVETSTARNMVFSRDAIQLATRIPDRPEEGDLAVDTMVITDDVSGLSFEVAMFFENRRIKYEISAAWGQAVVNPKNLALLVD